MSAATTASVSSGSVSATQAGRAMIVELPKLVTVQTVVLDAVSVSMANVFVVPVSLATRARKSYLHYLACFRHVVPIALHTAHATSDAVFVNLGGGGSIVTTKRCPVAPRCVRVTAHAVSIRASVFPVSRVTIAASWRRVVAKKKILHRCFCLSKRRCEQYLPPMGRLLQRPSQRLVMNQRQVI